MKKKLIDRRLDDHVVVTHAGPHAIYAAAVYHESYVEDVVIRKKVVKSFTTRLVQGRTIHPYQVKDLLRARMLHVLVSAAAGLNREILALVVAEEAERAKPVPKPRKKK